MSVVTFFPHTKHSDASYPMHGSTSSPLYRRWRTSPTQLSTKHRGSTTMPQRTKPGRPHRNGGKVTRREHGNGTHSQAGWQLGIGKKAEQNKPQRGNLAEKFASSKPAPGQVSSP